MEAIITLNKIGADYGIDFPLPEEEKGTIMYIAQYGSEIVCHCTCQQKLDTGSHKNDSAAKESAHNHISHDTAWG